MNPPVRFPLFRSPGGFGLTTFSRSGNTSVFAAIDAVLSSEHSAYGVSAGMNLRW